MQHEISYEHCGVYRCHAQPLNLRASAVFVLINYNRELKIINAFTVGEDSVFALTVDTRAKAIIDKEINFAKMDFFISSPIVLL